ncbi:efflux RND transporter permease subunit [Halarcobacter ebronensis]|uniref:Multidrug transporter AcrB n=1 Tax=Halarcobacter ebronensis TaxID=1462615 RepID=A0A4Q1AWE8_9BACT|nr:efflux RND transporter permease subunit [Halarcobacter ebronensis]QKF81315.1 RND family efflux system, inner membrane transporter, AcrB family [Halarcobacter ebronensis]RXK04880.1 multidrug transporter AcrB [Halarcobacter ebronensis]
MDFAKFSLKNKLLVYMLTILGVAYGLIVYERIGKLQDPEFTIKDALVITNYPGASAVEVEKEVSNRLEETIQTLPYVKKIITKNSAGQSFIQVTMKDKYKSKELQQIWDELRKKINETYLPPRVETPYINDDFGDVYGIVLSIYGDDYTYEELKDYVDYLKKELILVEGVGKVDTFGEQQRALIVEINKEKLSQLGISKEQIANELYLKNLIPNFGRINVGTEFIRVNADGFTNVKELENIVIKGNGSNSQIFLKDIATIKDSYKEPSSELLKYDGHNSIAIGISTAKGGNVVKMGELLDQKLEELEKDKPLGIKIGVISHQGKDVEEAINSFMVNLIEAVAIVIIVLLIFMGLRSGLIIGAVLLVTIIVSFIFMPMLGILLERVSLGALIIALGMLVDNAIVVVDGILVRINRGINAKEAASTVVKQTAFPLFGATIIAILAFGAIGLSDDSTGEFTRSLFYVVMISLGLSWVTAMTLTPILAVQFLKQNKKKRNNKEADEDEYKSFLYKAYGTSLKFALNHRFLIVAIALVVFVLSLMNFKHVKQSFFPDSSRPQIIVDYFLPQGTAIETTTKYLDSLNDDILKLEGVEHISTFIGSGSLRFILTYDPEKPNPAFAQMLIDVKDYKESGQIIKKIENLAKRKYPDLNVYGKKFILGPGDGGKVQAKIFGKDLDKIRFYEQKIYKIFEESPYSKGIRSDWRNRVKVLKPIISYEKANLNGITKDDIAQAILDTFQGRTIGVYRDGTELLPIILRSPKSEREDVKNLENIQIFSPVANKMIPLKQLITSYKTVFEDDIIYKYNRKRALTIHADPILGKLPNDLLFDIKDKVENIDFEDGYHVEWFGEYKSSNDAQKPIMQSLPLFFILMVLIMIALFNSLKKTIIIWLAVPFALIGVVIGLLVMDLPFGFMSLLGFLSLSGMLIKNAIVLIDEITLENEINKLPLNEAIHHSGISRLRAVSMAALTTALGMIPLVSDPFFASMAVVIIFGLVVATILTMILVPVFYAIFFKAERLN